jgi:hypothetical protein
MRTVAEVSYGDYPEVLRILINAGARVPRRLLGDPDLDVEALLARLGVSAAGRSGTQS